jgi:hypothetical protein
MGNPLFDAVDVEGGELDRSHVEIIIKIRQGDAASAILPPQSCSARCAARGQTAQGRATSLSQRPSRIS